MLAKITNKKHYTNKQKTKIDENFNYHGAPGRLRYDIHNKNRIPHLGINDPSNGKANINNSGYQENNFFIEVAKNK